MASPWKVQSRKHGLIILINLREFAMKLDSARIEQLRTTAATYLAWLKAWLAPVHLAQLRPMLKFQTGVLAGFALLASVLLGVTNCTTQGTIQQRLEEDLQQSLEEVVPASWYDNAMQHDIITLDSSGYNLGANETTVYLAKKAGKITAVCFKFTAPDGYSGAINMIMGLDRQGTLLGVRVLSHKETPGLGDKIEVAKSNWILSFVGRSLATMSASQWAVKKDGGDIDQFAGATITPRKAVQAIYRGLHLFKANQALLLKQ